MKIFEIARRLGVESADIRHALDKLLEEGKIETRGKAVGTKYYKKGHVPAIEDEPVSTQGAKTGANQRSEREGELPLGDDL